MNLAAGRAIDLHLHLLDRQIVDPNGRMVGKVDDVELEVDERGRPYVTAILLGPRALGPRLGGRLGRWVATVGERLAGGREPQRIDFSLVTDIGSAISISRPRDQLDVTPLAGWVDEHVIARIPGSHHESE